MKRGLGRTKNYDIKYDSKQDVIINYDKYDDKPESLNKPTRTSRS